MRCEMGQPTCGLSEKITISTLATGVYLLSLDLLCDLVVIDDLHR